MPWPPLGAAALLAGAITVWWYGHREERVRGRGLAAVLKGAALFLILSAPWLPAFSDRASPGARTALLLDQSLSMGYPAVPGEEATRLDVARQAVEELLASRPDARTWAFAGTARRIESTDLEQLEASGGASRVVAAIELARAAGSDSLIVVTDGELTDREEGRRLAERFAVHVREVRVASSAPRTVIRALTAPGVVTAGDTFEVRAAIVAAGRSGDSARVVLDFGPGAIETATVELPDPGRSTDAVFRVLAAPAVDSTEWRSLSVRVEGVPEPWDVAAEARSWILVTPDPAGAVLVALEPDWEARYLAPVLERSVPGGARVFLRVADRSYLTAGARPVGGIPEAAVQRAARGATLLVIQGSPADLPAWVESIVQQHPAVMYLLKGAGPVPGTGQTAEEALPGEWYVESPPPPGPVSGHIMGVEVLDLPPLARVHGSLRSDGAVLSARRNRQGEPQPAARIGTTGGRRWAVFYGEGSWRWAARGDQGLDLHRGLFAGTTRWLIERSAPRPIRLAEPHPRSGDSVRWRTAPDVRNLAVRLEGASGMNGWSDTVPAPAHELAGPPLGRGEARFVATGTVRGQSFRVTRPFYVNAGAEELPGVVGPPLEVRPVEVPESGERDGVAPPVWPFAAAIALLCGEWLWRRRVGLR